MILRARNAIKIAKKEIVTLRHNKVRNITAKLLREVCKDVTVELQLQPLTGESFEAKTANISDEARVDISTRGFWITSQLAFFDVRVFNPTAKRYVSQKLLKTYAVNENEKKRSYNERVMQVEHGSFTPLVMSATGGMARECKRFYARLAEMVAEKRNQHYSLISAWIRRKICFALLSSICIFLRGSRTLFHNVSKVASCF